MPRPFDSIPGHRSPASHRYLTDGGCALSRSRPPLCPFVMFALSPYAWQAWEAGCAHKECIWFQVRKLRSSSVDLWRDSLGWGVTDLSSVVLDSISASTSLGSCEDQVRKQIWKSYPCCQVIFQLWTVIFVILFCPRHQAGWRSTHSK